MPNNTKNIVVFASKKVGLGVLEFLGERKDSLLGVVAARAEDEEILAWARERGIACCVFGDGIREFIVGLIGIACPTPSQSPQNSQPPQDIQSSQSPQNSQSHPPYFSWLVNAWSPHILPKALLDLFAHRVNLHPSLAPYCLGNDNAAWAIMESASNLAGGGHAGVSLLEMEERVDEGGVYVSKPIAFDFPTKGKDLHERLERECLACFREHWEAIYTHKLTPKALGVKSKYTRSQTNQSKTLHWEQEIKVGQFVSIVLANDFSPRYSAILQKGEKQYCLVIEVKEVDATS